MKTMRVVGIAMLAASFGCGDASAATVTYLLNQVGGGGSSGALNVDGVDYAQVTISDDPANNEIDFTVSLLANVTGYFTSTTGSSGIKSFGFNVAGPGVSYSGTSLTGKGITNIATGFTVPSDHSIDGFGSFEVKLDRTGNTGRLNPLTFSLETTNALWTGLTAASFFELSSGSATQGNTAFAVGVTGITTAGYSGGNPFFGGSAVPVPLPAAAWLFGSALLGGGLLARRRRVRG